MPAPARIARPLWTGGGIVFGPAPRSYTVKVNRKARRGALRSALSVHAERESIAVFDGSDFDAPSTAQAASLLRDWGAASPVLVLLDAQEEAAGKSFRNIPRVEAVPVSEAGVADLMWAASLLVSQDALPSLVARASGRGRNAAGAEASGTRSGDAARSASGDDEEGEA